MNLFRLTAALALVMGLLTPGTSRAAFAMKVSVDGVNYFQVASGADFGDLDFSGSISATGVLSTNPTSSSVFKINVHASADNGDPFGDPINLTLFGSIKHLTNGTHKLWVLVTQTGYSLPSGDTLIVESSMGGTGANCLTSLSGIFQAYADAGDSKYGTSGYTNGPQSGKVDPMSFGTGSASGKFTPHGDYSLTSQVTLSVAGKNNTVLFGNEVNVTAVPAPAGLAALACGSPVLALAWLRRRAVKSQRG